MGSVFISYRHEDEAHWLRVRSLVDRIRDSNIAIIHDASASETEFHGGAPPRGWALWSIQNAADMPSVLIVPSSGWFRVLNHPEPITSGLGSAAEAETVVQRLYQSSGYNDFAAFAYFDRQRDLADLPHYLQKLTQFDVGDQRSYASLIQWLQRPGANNSAPPSAPRDMVSVAFPTTPSMVDSSDFLDCRAVFEAYERLAAPDNRHRVLLLEGASEHGKSELMHRFYRHAVKSFGPDSSAFLSFAPPLKSPDRHLDLLGDAWKESVASGRPTNERTRVLLKLRENKPTFLFVDGYEHAETELAIWLDEFLDRVGVMPLLRILVAGRKIPAYRLKPWSIYASAAVCDPFGEPDAFIDLAARAGSTMSPEEIRACCQMLRSQRDRRKVAGQPADGLSPLALISEIRTRLSTGAPS